MMNKTTTRLSAFANRAFTASAACAALLLAAGEARADDLKIDNVKIWAPSVKAKKTGFFSRSE